MGRFKQLFTNWRVLMLLVFLVGSLIVIQGGFVPHYFREGVAIRSVVPNSSAYIAGFSNPVQKQPMSREVVVMVDQKQVKNLQDYYAALEGLQAGIPIQIKTNKGFYTVMPIAKEPLGVNGTANVTIGSEVEDIGLRVYDAPTTNIRKGLDLSGGTRILLQPEEKLSQDDVDILISNMQERLNIYGLSDIVIREAGDLSNNQYILVEIAGASDDEVKDLIAKQGKFEGRIGNSTVFRGGQDITSVCREPKCSGIDPNFGCRAVQGGQYVCRFFFSITLSPEAAARQGEATSKLEVITEDKEQFLSEKLALILDDKNVDELRIAADLKGKSEQQIQISGSGAGNTEQEAAANSLTNMKKLQTILITGSLPVKLNVVKTDNLSAFLGTEFVRNALLIGLLSLIAVMATIIIRYRKIKVSLPILVTMVSELVIILGVAALIGWNIDLAAIAGIIITIGSGVNHQVIITDETLRKQQDTDISGTWKSRIQNAFFIIMGSYFTLVVAMIPLIFAGAGLLRGFAIITIIGVTVGVFITRPAYAAIVEILLKE